MVADRFSQLLTLPGVEEQLVLGSRVGFMAFHGGALERVTDVVAREAAERIGASYYGIVHPDIEDLPHVPSTAIDPARSSTLAEFFERVDTVVALHGYGRRHLRWSFLLGGRNRPFAQHLAAQLRPALPDYDFVDDLDRIPKMLRGQHRSNPVNLAQHGGVQIELPPTIRWKWGSRAWSDQGDAGRAPQTQQLIDALASAVQAWEQPPS